MSPLSIPSLNFFILFYVYLHIVQASKRCKEVAEICLYYKASACWKTLPVFLYLLFSNNRLWFSLLVSLLTHHLPVGPPEDLCKNKGHKSNYVLSFLPKASSCKSWVGLAASNGSRTMRLFRSLVQKFDSASCYCPTSGWHDV